MSENFTLPADLTLRGLAIRPERDADLPYLQQLYALGRAAEVAAARLNAAAGAAFLAEQFRLQRKHYRKHYADGAFLVLTHRGAAAGRLYLHRTPGELRLVDILLAPELRGGGIGTRLLQAVCELATREGRTVTLHVDRFNPAQRLYLRLGFRPVGEEGSYLKMARSPT